MLQKLLCQLGVCEDGSWLEALQKLLPLCMQKPPDGIPPLDRPVMIEISIRFSVLVFITEECAKI